MRRVMRITWIINVDNNDWFGDGDDVEAYEDGDDDGDKADWY